MNIKIPRAIVGFSIHNSRFTISQFTILPPYSDLLGLVAREDPIVGIDDTQDKSQHLMIASRVCLLMGRRAGKRIFARIHDLRFTIDEPIVGLKREKKSEDKENGNG